jgi:diaminopimelate decarboxylase
VETPFQYEGGELRAGGVEMARLAAEHGTPLYVYHRPTIEARLDAVRRAFREHPTQICYSVKANSNLRLLKWLAGLGVGFDVVSAGEIARTAVCGVRADRVVFAGVGKTRAELEAGVEAGLWMINVESVDEARALGEIAALRSGLRVPISLRINPDVDAGTHRHITTGTSADKFGISPSEYRSLLPWLAGVPGLHLVGLHMHLGSQITDPDPFRRGIAVLLECGAEARSAGLDPRWLNAGGGFGIAYEDGEAPDPAAYAAVLIPAAREFGAELLLELGRYLVGPAGCLLTEVQYRKTRGSRELVIVDAGMTDLLRPALYDAFHRIVPVRGFDPASARPTDVAGPICESTDFLGRERRLPPLERGDLLAVLDAGAYGMSMASHYNTHPRAAEVWIDERGAVERIRRRETAADLLAVEREALDPA